MILFGDNDEISHVSFCISFNAISNDDKSDDNDDDDDDDRSGNR